MRILILSTLFLSGCASQKINSLIVRDGELESGKMIATGYVNGEKREFNLDTGATSTALIFDESTKNLEVVGTAGKAGASGASIKGDKVRVGLFEVGTLKLKNVDVARYQGAKQNYLGNNLFLDRIMELKISQSKILFPEKVESYPHSVNFELLEKNHIRFPVGLDKTQQKAIFDTGAELNSIDKKYVEKNPELFTFVQNVDNGADSTATKFTMKLYRLKHPLVIGGEQFEIGNILAFDFGDPLRKYFGAQTPLILGVNTIRHRDWVVNFKNQTLHFSH